jgi:tRNA(Ile)-lysidine synthase
MTGDPVRTLRTVVDAAIGELAGKPIGVACSGGADSMALADAAIANGAQIVVVTVDHQLSPGSSSVAAAVAAWARGRGAVADVRVVDVVRRASLEAAAREARYAALEAAIETHGLRAMLLAHTARDQAETVLLRIVRGTGPAGLAGMAVRRGAFVRPLLALRRSEIDAYVVARELPTWSDPMNADLAYARVRMREQLLPALRAENPAIDDALVRLASSAREWLDAIDALAAPWAAFPIACSALASQPAAIRKRALSRALDGAGIAYDAVHLDQLDALICAGPRGEVAVDVPGGRVIRSYDTLAPVAEVAPARLAAPPGCALRRWQPGDRMRLGPHTRKLSDLYGDLKVPRHLREHARVLVRASDDVIVWAEHLGVAFGEPQDLLPIRTGGSFRSQ